MSTTVLQAEAQREEVRFQPFHAWSSIAILILFSLFSTLDRQIIALQVDPIRHALRLSDTELGLLQGFAFALLYAVAGLPLGWAVDRFPRRLVLHLGISLWSISAAATGLAGSFWQMFFARTSVGVGEAVLAPSSLSLISDIFPRQRAASALGVYSCAFYVGAGGALAIGGLVVQQLARFSHVELPLIGTLEPWRAVFIVTGLPGLVIGLLAYAIKDPAHGAARASEPVSSDWNKLFSFVGARKRLLSIAFVGFGLVSFVAYAISSWAPTYFIRVHGMAPIRIGGLFGMIMALAAPGAIVGGVLTDALFRRGRTDANFLVAGLAGLAAGPFLIAAFIISSINVALTSFAVGMLLYGATAPGPYSTFQRLSPPAFRGRIMASFVLFNALIGAGLAPLAVGAVTDHVFHSPLAVGSSIALVLAIAIPLMVLILLLGRRALKVEEPARQP